MPRGNGKVETICTSFTAFIPERCCTEDGDNRVLVLIEHPGQRFPVLRMPPIPGRDIDQYARFGCILPFLILIAAVEFLYRRIEYVFPALDKDKWITLSVERQRPETFKAAIFENPVALELILILLQKNESPEQDRFIKDFSEKLWLTTIDMVTVYHDGRMAFRFKSGMEVTK